MLRSMIGTKLVLCGALFGAASIYGSPPLGAVEIALMQISSLAGMAIGFLVVTKG